MKKVLEVRHLTKRYGQHLALDNVNLTLEKGEVYGLIGRNGAGKTTLIKVITKLIRPSQGSVSLFHSTSKSEWTHALKRVGSVIETPVALNHLNARQNLRYYCKIHHVPNPDNVIDEILDTVGLGHTGKKKFRSFSLGMKQRLGIAIALIAKPDLLILDEPTNHLDIPGKEALEESLLDYTGTILFVSHDRYFIKRIATSLLVLDDKTAEYYPVTYEEYEEGLKEKELKTIIEEVKEEKKEPPKQLSKDALRREIAKVEKQITEKENELEDKRALRFEPEYYQDYTKMAVLDEEIDVIHNELAHLYEKWEQLQE